MSVHAYVRKLKGRTRYEGTFLRWHASTVFRAEIFGIPKLTQRSQPQLTHSRTSSTRAESIALLFICFEVIKEQLYLYQTHRCR